VNILRRLPLSRLLLLCGLVVAVGISATALASALGSAPTPAPKPLAAAVHDALAAPPVEGFSADVRLTDRLIEGANLASGGNGEASQLSSSPLLSGASGRVWIAKDGRVRLELRAEKGDTEIYYDGHTATLFDASTNTLYRYVVPSEGASPQPEAPGEQHEVPSLAKIEEAISHLEQHANVSGATPSDVAGQPTYTVRVSPNERGSLIGGAELSWDANNGVPLRAAVYSSTSSSPRKSCTSMRASSRSASAGSGAGAPTTKRPWSPLSAVESASVSFHRGWWHCTISTACAIHPMQSISARPWGAACRPKQISGSMRGLTKPSSGTRARFCTARLMVRS